MGIKDLFQRTINRKRITGPEGLISYFKDKDKVKYFNPIALCSYRWMVIQISHEMLRN